VELPFLIFNFQSQYQGVYWDTARNCASYALGIRGIRSLDTNTLALGTVETMIGALKLIGKRYQGYIGIALMMYDFTAVLLNQPDTMNLFMYNQSKLNSRLSEIVNVLFIIGYIVDFIERKINLQVSLKYISMIPFVLNFIILIYLLFYKLKIKETEENCGVKISSVIFRLY
jgi:hypothetical protein